MYLIDDSELKDFNIDFLRENKYNKVVTYIRNMQDFNKLGHSFDDTDCIMVHKTFCNSNKVYQQMSSVAGKDERPIPFVAFSAGDAESVVYNESDPLSIDGLKKSVFYERLQYFLDDFIANGKVNLRILAYGKDYMKVLVRSWALAILRLIAGKTGMVKLEDISRLASHQSFKLLIEAANIDYADFLEELEDNPVSFDRFRMNINNIVNSFNQYGKNIYTWK